MRTSARNGRSPTFFHVLARRPLLAGATLLTVAVMGTGYLCLATRYYTSIVRLHVQPTSLHPLGGLDISSGDARDTFLNTQKSVLVSNPVIALALSNGDVAGAKCLQTANPILYLKNQLRSDVARKGELTLEFTCPDRQESALIVNEVARAYITLRSRQHHLDAERVIGVLEKEKQSSQAEAQRMYDALLDVQKPNGAPTPEACAGQLASLQKLRDALTETTLDLATVEIALREAVSSAREAGLEPGHGDARSAGLTTDADAEQLKTSILTLHQALEQLSATYGKSHPRVDTVRGQLERTMARYTNSLQQQMKQLLERQARLRAAIQDGEMQAFVNAEKAVQWTRLQSNLKRLEQQSQMLEQKLIELRAEADVQLPGIAYVLEARPAEKPSSPDLLRSIGVLLLAGSGSAISVVIFREWQAPRIESAAEARRILGGSVAGSIPSMPKRISEVTRGQCVQNDPLSDGACAIRSLAWTLLPRLEPLGIKTLVITAAQKGDGATMVAANLALAFASLGKRVLLVDANFQSPRLNVLWGAAEPHGFGDELMAETSGFVETVTTAVEGLDVLPVGAVPDNVEGNLNGDKLPSLLEHLGERYDLVLFDTAAMAGCNQSRVLAASCGGALLVARCDHTARRSLEESYDGLLSVGARLAGVVINGAGPLSARRQAGRGHGSGREQAAATEDRALVRKGGSDRQRAESRQGA